MEDWGEYNSLDYYKPTEHYVSSLWRLDFGADFTLISWVRAIPNPTSASSDRKGTLFALSDGTPYTSLSGQRYFGIRDGKVFFEALGYVSVSGTGTEDACTNVADGTWRHWTIRYNHATNIMTIHVDGALCMDTTGVTNTDFASIPAPTATQRVSLGYHQSDNLEDLVHGALGHTKYYPSVLSDEEVNANKGAQPNDIGFGVRLMVVNTSTVKPYFEVHYPASGVSVTCIAIDSSLPTPSVDTILAQSTAENTLSNLSGYAGHSDAVAFGDNTLTIPFTASASTLYCAAKNEDGSVKTLQTVVEENKINFHADYELMVSEVTSAGTPVFLPEYYWLNFHNLGSYTFLFKEATTSTNTGVFFCHQPHYTFSYADNAVNGVKCMRLNNNVVRYDCRNDDQFKWNVNINGAAYPVNTGEYVHMGFAINHETQKISVYVAGNQITEWSFKDTQPIIQPSNLILFATTRYGGLTGTIQQMRYYHRVLSIDEVNVVRDEDPNKDVPTMTIQSSSATDSSIVVSLQVMGTSSTSLSAYAIALESSAPVPLVSQIVAQAAPVAITAGQVSAVSLTNLNPDTQYSVYIALSMDGRIVTTDAQVLTNIVTLTTKMSLACIAFKTTVGCTPYGEIDSSSTYTCSSIIPSSVSGYCACANGINAGYSYCGHEPFNCNDICVNGIYSLQIDGWMAKTYANFGSGISGVPTGISAYRTMNPSYNLYLPTLNYSGSVGGSGSVNNIPQSEYTGLVIYHSAIFTAPTSGTYQFGVIRDDSLMLLIDSYDTSNNVVYYTSWSGSEEMTSVDLEAGDHKIVVLWSNGGGGYKCTVNIYDPQGININDKVRIGLGTKNGVQAWYTLLDSNTCDWPSSSSVSAGYGNSTPSYRNVNYFPNEPNLDLYTSETRTFSSAGDVLGNNFYAVYVANVYIPHPGSYTFTVTAHGLVRVKANAISQLTLDGCSSSTTGTFTMYLDFGILPLHIEYLSNSETPELRLEWESAQAGISKQVISTNYYFIEDTDAPQISLSSPYNGAMKVTESEVPVTLTSSEPLMTLDSSAITVENGVVNSVTKVSNVQYTIMVAPSSTIAVVRVYVAAGAIVANNAIKNVSPSETVVVNFGNYDFTATIRLLEGFAKDAYNAAPSLQSNLYTIGVDTTVPTAYIALEIQQQTSQREVQGYIYFSEDMAYMDQNALEITGGSLVEGSFRAIDDNSINRSYQFTVRANAGSVVYVTVSKSSTPYYDTAGNILSLFNPVSYIYKSDSSVLIPTLSTSYVMPVSTASVPIKITLDHEISSLPESAFTASAGTISNVSGSGKDYTATFTFTNPSSSMITGSVQINEDALLEATGSSNLASNILTILYNDSVMTLMSIVPTNNMVNVPIDTQTIVLTFESEVVRGSGNAILSSDSQTIVYPSNSANIEFSGNSVVFRITQPLIGDKTYSLVIPSYFFLDSTSFKYFNGLAANEYSFHVGCSFCSVPQITSTLPETINGSVGMNLSLSVVVSAIPAATSQWYLNGMPIPGATSPVYTKVMTNSDFGVYYLIATNSFGTAQSPSVVVFQSTSRPVPTILPVTEEAICSGTYTVTILWDKPVSASDCSIFATSSSYTCLSVQVDSTISWTAILTLSGTGYESITLEILENKITDDFNNQNEGTTFEVVVDCVPPAITNYSPAHQATDIALGSSVVLTFNEVVHKVEGQGSASLECVSPDACTPIAIPASSISINEAGTAVTFRPSVALDPLKKYTLIVSSNLLSDAAGNFFQGLVSGAYYFTSTSATAPVLLSTVPAHQATGVALNGVISLTFSKEVMYGGSGSILLRVPEHDDVVIDGSLLSFVGTTVSFVYSNLRASSTYSVITSGNAIVETSTSHVPYAGLSEGEYQFSTINRPDLVSITPESGSIEVPLSPSIVLTFTIPVTRGAGFFIFASEAGDVSVDVTSGLVTISADGLIATITPTFVSGTTYTLTAPEGIFVSTENVPVSAITDYTITTAVPLTYTITPEPNSINNPIQFTISLHFNREIVTVQTNPVVTISSTNSINTVGSINSEDHTIVDYTFSTSLTPGAAYYINVPAGLVIDAVGMTNTAMDLFTYSIAPRPTITSTVPNNGAINIPVSQVFTFTFDMSIIKNTGSITLAASGASTISLDINSGNCQIDGSVLTVTLPSGTTLNNGASYTLTVPQGIVKSSLDIESAAHTLTFSTPAFPILTQQTPSHLSTGLIPDNVNIILTFSQSMQKGTGSIQFVGSNVATVTVDVTSSQVTISGTVVTISPTLLPPGTYDIVIPSGVLMSTNNAPFAGITAGQYTITTIYAADISKFVIEGSNFVNGVFSGSYTSGVTVTLTIRFKNTNNELITDITGVTCGGSSLSTLTTSIILSNSENVISVTSQPMTSQGTIAFSFTPTKVGTYTLMVRGSCGSSSNVDIANSPFTNIVIVAGPTSASHITVGGTGYGVNVPQLSEVYILFSTFDVNDNPTDPTDYATGLAVYWTLPNGYLPIVSSGITRDSAGVFRYSYTAPIITANIDFEMVTVQFKYNNIQIPTTLSYVRFTNPYNSVCPKNCNMRQGLGLCTASGCVCNNEGYYALAGCDACPDTVFEPELIECNNHGTCSAAQVTQTAVCSCDSNYSGQSCGTLTITEGQNPHIAADENSDIIISQFTIHGYAYSDEADLQKIKLALADVLYIHCCYEFIVTPMNQTSALKRVFFEAESSFESRIHVAKEQSSSYADILAMSMTDGTFLNYLKKEGISTATNITVISVPTAQGPVCNDREINGDETDVDCGGSVCAPCEQDKMCLVDTDCQSGKCDPETKTCAFVFPTWGIVVIVLVIVLIIVIIIIILIQKNNAKKAKRPKLTKVTKSVKPVNNPPTTSTVTPKAVPIAVTAPPSVAETAAAAAAAAAAPAPAPAPVPAPATTTETNGGNGDETPVTPVEKDESVQV